MSSQKIMWSCFYVQKIKQDQVHIVYDATLWLEREKSEYMK